MLPDCHSLLDEVIEILRQVRGQTLGLQDPQDLVASDKTYLGHTMGVPQNHTYKRWQTGLKLGHCMLLVNSLLYASVSLYDKIKVQQMTEAVAILGASSTVSILTNPTDFWQATFANIMLKIWQWYRDGAMLKRVSLKQIQKAMSMGSDETFFFFKDQVLQNILHERVSVCLSKSLCLRPNN